MVQCGGFDSSIGALAAFWLAAGSFHCAVPSVVFVHRRLDESGPSQRRHARDSHPWLRLGRLFRPPASWARAFDPRQQLPHIGCADQRHVRTAKALFVQLRGDPARSPTTGSQRCDPRQQCLVFGQLLPTANPTPNLMACHHAARPVTFHHHPVAGRGRPHHHLVEQQANDLALVVDRGLRRVP